MFKWIKSLFGGKKEEETKPGEEAQVMPEQSMETPEEPQESAENTEMSASEDNNE